MILAMVFTLNDSVLDNPAWNALTGRQARLAVGNDRARFFAPEFTTLAGVAKKTPECFAALRDHMQVGQVVMVTTQAPLPDGWQDGFELVDEFCDRSQMACSELKDIGASPVPSHLRIERLDERDIPAMAALVELTRPGPFRSRTIELGTFLGIKDGGTLVAMCGERTHPGETFDEITAVCTHPDYQGRGYARALVHTLAGEILSRGHTAFLHTRTDNASAIKSYANVGFVHRADMQFLIIRKV